MSKTNQNEMIRSLAELSEAIGCGQVTSIMLLSAKPDGSHALTLGGPINLGGALSWLLAAATDVWRHMNEPPPEAVAPTTSPSTRTPRKRTPRTPQ